MVHRPLHRCWTCTCKRRLLIDMQKADYLCCSSFGDKAAVCRTITLETQILGRMRVREKIHLLGTMAAAPPSLLGAGPLAPTREGRPERPIPFVAPLASFIMRAGPSDCLALSVAGLRPPSVCLLLLLLILLYTAHILELLSDISPARAVSSWGYQVMARLM